MYALEFSPNLSFKLILLEKKGRTLECLSLEIFIGKLSKFKIPVNSELPLKSIIFCEMIWFLYFDMVLISIRIGKILT